MGHVACMGGDWLGCVEWIQLAQDRGQWKSVVNVVMNLRVYIYIYIYIYIYTGSHGDEYESLSSGM
jgi:hypothetical protein